MKNTLLFGIAAILLIPLVPLADWIYYHDRKSFIPPVHYIGKVPIRKDVYGDGYFGAPRKGKRTHKGIDISAPLYSEVRASKGGRTKVRLQKNGMGKYVVIIHPEGYVTLYGHLSKFSVRDNERVRQGEVIGYIGKTGNANHEKIKPHLHFEIREGGKHIDPLFYIE